MTDRISDTIENVQARLAGFEEPEEPVPADGTVEERLTRVERDLSAIYGRLNRLLLVVTAALVSEWAKVIL